VRSPRPPPLFVNRPVPVKEGLPFLPSHLLERGRKMVVDEDILRTRDLQPRFFHFATVIIILEETCPILLADRTAECIRSSRHHHTEEGHGAEKEELAQMRQRVDARALGHLIQSRIVDLDLRLVPNIVGHGSKQSDLGMIRQMVQKCQDPSLGHDRIIIEQYQILTRGRRQTQIVPSREAHIVSIEDDLDRGMATLKFREIVDRSKRYRPRRSRGLSIHSAR